MLHKFGSNWDLKTNGNLVILVNSSHRSHLIAGGLLLGSRRARGRPQLRAGVGKAPSWLPLASWPAFIARASPPFSFSLPLFSRRHRRCSVELASPPQRKPASAKHRLSSACSLRTQPTNLGPLISPRNAASRLSSSRPAGSPSSECRRGQRSPVSRCSCSVYLQLRLVPVMLYDRLIAPFVHCSHRSTTVTVARTAVAAVTVDLHLC